MNSQRITLEAAKTAAMKQENCLIYFSDYILLTAPAKLTEEQVNAIFSEESFRNGRISEARFFSENEELEFLPVDEAVAGIDTKGKEEEAIVSRYLISPRVASGRALKVREYIRQDTDGQIYTVKTCLAGIEEV